MGKSRDSRDRISITFDIGQLRERLKAQAIEPSQSLASIVRMALIEWLEQREAAVSLLFGKRHGRVLNFDRDLYLNSIAVSLNSIALHTAKTNFPVKSKQSTRNQHATCGKVN
jgi:hypothetical protein